MRRLTNLFHEVYFFVFKSGSEGGRGKLTKRHLVNWPIRGKSGRLIIRVVVKKKKPHSVPDLPTTPILITRLGERNMNCLDNWEHVRETPRLIKGLLYYLFLILI